MPKLAKALGAIEIKRLTEPGLHAVGNVPGLNLRISDTGAKTWALRISIQGRQTEIGGIGGYPGIPLAQALGKARELRQSESKMDITQGARNEPPNRPSSALSRPLLRPISQCIPQAGAMPSTPPNGPAH
jgi:hypothetical protein